MNATQRAIFDDYTLEELVQIAEEYQMVIIEEDALCRKLAGQLRNKSIGDVDLMEILTTAPLVALELANRIRTMLGE